MFAGLTLTLRLDTVVHPSLSPLANDDFVPSLSAFDAKRSIMSHDIYSTIISAMLTSSMFTYKTQTHNRKFNPIEMSLVVSTARALFITAVSGGTVYGSVKAGVWSTDGNKSVKTLQEIREEIKLPPTSFLQRDSPVNGKHTSTIV